MEVLLFSLMCLHSLHTDNFAFIRGHDLCAAVVNLYIFYPGMVSRRENGKESLLLFCPFLFSPACVYGM